MMMTLWPNQSAAVNGLFTVRSIVAREFESAPLRSTAAAEAVAELGCLQKLRTWRDESLFVRLRGSAEHDMEYVMSDLTPTEKGPQVITIGKKEYSMEQAENAAKIAGNWFILIAGLSLVNSISSFMHWDLEMVFGLGLLGFTRLIRAAIEAKSEEFGITAITAALAYGVAALLSAAFFYYLGVKARRLSLTAFRVGMAFYLADAVLLAVVGEWIGFAFHAFVLFMIWCGYGIAKQVVRVHAELPPAAA